MGGAGEEGEKVECRERKKGMFIITKLLLMLIVTLECDHALGDLEEV